MLNFGASKPRVRGGPGPPGPPPLDPRLNFALGIVCLPLSKVSCVNSVAIAITTFFFFMFQNTKKCIHCIQIVKENIFMVEAYFQERYLFSRVNCTIILLKLQMIQLCNDQ